MLAIGYTLDDAMCARTDRDRPESAALLANLEETRREAGVVKKTAVKRSAAAKGGAGTAQATAKRAPAKKSAPI